MAALPDVVKAAGGRHPVATDLGNAFLAQQGDVMVPCNACARRRQDTGKFEIERAAESGDQGYRKQEAVIVV